MVSIGLLLSAQATANGHDVELLPGQQAGTAIELVRRNGL